MQNDVLKNNIAPWQEKGRWYHAFFDNATSALDPTKTDDFIIDNFQIVDASSIRYICPNEKKIRIIDYVFDAKGEITSSTSTSLTYRYFTSGIRGASFGPVSLTGDGADIWLFVNVE